MDFKLTNKTIYVISPEPWGKMRVSKHHYALELAFKGNQVYFVEPPRLDNEGITIRQSQDHPLLSLVSYKPVFRGKRFLPVVLFRALLKRQIKLLKKTIGKQPDLILCFHPFLLEKLNWFDASHSIYFAADQFYADHLPPEVFSADFCLAISDSIYKRLNVSGRKVHLIQHGLNRYFARTANKLLLEVDAGKRNNLNSPLKVGYAGNLLMGGMDRVTMKKVIQTHPEVRFIFWGQYDLADGNFTVGLNDELTGFVDFLKSSSNVELRGVVSPDELSKQMSEADIFWICLKIGAGKIWDGSNSHKLLEYLSTGKPVITHYVSSYKGLSVLDMLSDDNNDKYPAHFSRVLSKVRSGEETTEKSRERINFALSNTYEKQIDRIEAWINEG